VAVALAAAVLAGARAASAQEQGIAAGYQGPVIKPIAPTETGVTVSDGVYLHAGIGAEMGYDSNVFYQSSAVAQSVPGQQGIVSAPILRVVPFLEINNQVRGSGTPTGLFFDLAATLQYRHYFAENNSAVDQSSLKNSFNPTISGLLDFSQAQRFGFSLIDTLARTEEAPYYAGAGPFVRTSNQGSAQVRWSPGGGRAQGVLRYSNRLDLFDSTGTLGQGQGITDLRYANSLTHEGMLDLSWRWLPKTALFFNGQVGFVHYLDPNASTVGVVPAPAKSDSIPLHLRLGIRGLVTERTAVSLSLGYGTAFYENSINPAGFGQLSAGGDVVFRPTPITAVSVGYLHDFANSIVGNFYYLDAVNLAFRQMIAGRITASALARYEYRRFSGVAINGRVDNFMQVGAAVDYYLKTWAYLGVGYSLFFNDSNFDGMPAMSTAGTTPLSASYVKHQVFARIGVTY